MAAKANRSDGLDETNVNPDLVRERKKAKFRTDDLTNVLDRGKHRTELRRRIESSVNNDPQYKPEEIAFMSQEERFNYSIKQQLIAVKKIRENGWNAIDNWEEINWIRSAIHGKEIPTMHLHLTMSLQSVLFQMTDEQQKKWLPAILNYTIIGTYAQTELGHGTYLRGLETTATYDPSTQEFVMHSPTLTSMKWWPGNLGKLVTHAIIAARLITAGKDYGIHLFMVQLRSIEDHRSLPGVELGDIGPKLGYANVDNGFLRLDHVRIPRDQMLMRFSQVDPDGTYNAPPHSKIGYNSMVQVRSLLVHRSGIDLAKGAIIATRYSAVRRQSELIPGRTESQIINYQSQQMKLFPQIATAYAFILTGYQLDQLYQSYVYQAKGGDFSALPELHSTSAGLKAFSTECTRDGLEVLRMSCGGHGFSSASAFTELYGVSAPTCTYEGENTVMLLQNARFLIKTLRQSLKGAKLTPFMSYLQLNQHERCRASDPEDFKDVSTLILAYKHRARRMVTQAFRNLESDMKDGKNHAIAWNSNHLHLLLASIAHCHLFVVENFNRAVESVQCEDETRRILRALMQLYALDGILKNKGEFLESSYLSVKQLDLVSKQFISLLAEIRPNAVALVDAFDVPDFKLGSVLGRYDGNVYENLYKWAKSAPLNRKDVADAYHLHIKPFLAENQRRVQSRL